MLSERNVHVDVRNLLLSGEPFQYAHLIKFERPSRPNELSGKVSTSAQRYTYLTDASRDVIFDDLSKDHDGNYNGPQNYIANKVLNVTEIQEAVEAKADTCSLTLDGNGIGGYIKDTITIYPASNGTGTLSPTAGNAPVIEFHAYGSYGPTYEAALNGLGIQVEWPWVGQYHSGSQYEISQVNISFDTTNLPQGEIINGNLNLQVSEVSGISSLEIHIVPESRYYPGNSIENYERLGTFSVTSAGTVTVPLSRVPRGPFRLLLSTSKQRLQESPGVGGDDTYLFAESANISLTIMREVESTVSGYWDIKFEAHNIEDILSAGFREGDKINITGTQGPVNIESFRAGNVVRVKKLDHDLLPDTIQDAIITLDSEEIKSILLDKNMNSYASFINREVFIYRAYFVNGKMVGETPDSEGRTGPILIFRGIINNVAFEEDDNSIKVQWGVSSHWGDFSQVKGRITSDEFHRALDQNGIPQPYSALKPIYAYDKGFMHSDTSLNMIATYTVMVDKTTIKAKNGFLGIGAKTKVKTVQVEEGRNTQLNVQLQNKSIPIIYGVRNTTGSPIFADTLKNDSSTVYIAYALSEGQIGGLYDLYIEGKSLICKDKEDLDARSKQTSEDTVDVICRGRADRGDVLGGTTAYSNSTTPYYNTPELRKVFNLIYNRNIQQLYKQYQGVPDESIDTVQYLGTGVIHGESVRLTSPQEIELEFFSGTESQAASSQLTTIAAQKNFKVQNDYWLAQDNAEYWGPNHRLIDTAYVVGKFKIKEGETTIPEIEYVVRGKVCECYNYDYSFTHDDKMTGESPDNFLLGDTVTLSTGQNVTIIDKWSFARPDGIIETRFRYSEDPELNYDDNGIPSITRFSMSKGGSTWTMVTHNWALDSGIVPAAISAPVDTIIDNPDNITVTFPPTPGVGGPGNWSIIDGNQNVLKEAIIGANISSNTLSSNLV